MCFSRALESLSLDGGGRESFSRSVLRCFFRVAGVSPVFGWYLPRGLGRLCAKWFARSLEREDGLE